MSSTRNSTAALTLSERVQVSRVSTEDPSIRREKFARLPGAHPLDPFPEDTTMQLAVEEGRSMKDLPNKEGNWLVRVTFARMESPSNSTLTPRTSADTGNRSKEDSATNKARRAEAMNIWQSHERELGAFDIISMTPSMFDVKLALRP